MTNVGNYGRGRSESPMTRGLSPSDEEAVKGSPPSVGNSLLPMTSLVNCEGVDNVTFPSVAVRMKNERDSQSAGGTLKEKLSNTFIRTASFFRPVLGMVVVMSGCFVFALVNIIIQMTKSVDSFHFAFVRAILFTLIAAPLVLFLKKDPFPKGHRIKLLIRGCLGGTGSIIHFYGMKHMPQGDVAMLTAGSPALTAIFAYFILKERIIPLDIFNVFLVLGGMVLIAKPPFIFGSSQAYEDDPQYAVAAIAVSCLAVIQANVFFVLRLLKELHFAQILLWFGLVATVVSGCALLLFSTPRVPDGAFEICMLLANGVLSFIAQIGLVQGTKLCEASKASLIGKCSDIVFAFSIQVLVFDQIPGLYGIIGTALISVVVVISGSKKILDSLPSDHWLKNTYLKSCYGEEQAEDIRTQENALLPTVDKVKQGQNC